MGEYAIRRTDEKQIKIGTCESMYYIRYEDRHKVKPLAGNVDLKDAHEYGLRFRLPIFAEDAIAPGDYEGMGHGHLLFHETTGKAFPIVEAKPGRIYARDEQSGIQVSFPCYHGQKLCADVGQGDEAIKFRASNYHAVAELIYLKAVRELDADLVVPVIRCRHCHDEWRCKWEDVWDYLDEKYQERFAKHTLFADSPAYLHEEAQATGINN